MVSFVFKFLGVLLIGLVIGGAGEWIRNEWFLSSGSSSQEEAIITKKNDCLKEYCNAGTKVFPVASIKEKVVNVALEDKIKALGYTPVAELEENDSTGRSLIYKNRQGYDDRAKVFVVEKTVSLEKKPDDIYLGFQDLKVPGYMRWIRVVLGSQSFYSPTKILLDDLSSPSYHPQVLSREEISQLQTLDLFQRGDIVMIGIRHDPNKPFTSLYDEKGVMIADQVEIRRWNL